MATCSIVLATYNGARYLPQQLESFRSQVRPPDEVVASDDGSSDGTWEMLLSFAADASFPVLVVHGPQQGCAENFWTAAQRSSGEVIAWSDQDDVWHPDKLRISLDAMARTGADMVSHAAAVVGPALEPTGRRYPSYKATRVLGPLQGDPLHVPSGFASAFRRSILAELDWEQRPQSHQHRYPLPHDHAVSLMAFARHQRVELADVLAQYRQHGSNLAGAPKSSGLSQLLGAIRASADDYRELAARAAGYAAWLEGAGAEEAAQYFRRFAEKATSRSQLRAAPRVGARGAALAGALRSGAYRSGDNAGFGAKALANDLVALAASMVPRHPGDAGPAS